MKNKKVMIPVLIVVILLAIGFIVWQATKGPPGDEGPEPTVQPGGTTESGAPVPPTSDQPPQPTRVRTK